MVWLVNWITMGLRSPAIAQDQQLFPTRNKQGSGWVIAVGLCLGTVGGWSLEQAIAPLAAQAYTSRMEITLTLQPGETYEVLQRRAQLVARAATQRSFDRDILIQDVAITILIDHRGAIVPLALLEVDRLQWRDRPDAHLWMSYYPTAKSLLNLNL